MLPLALALESRVYYHGIENPAHVDVCRYWARIQGISTPGRVDRNYLQALIKLTS